MTGDPVASKRRIVSWTAESWSALSSTCEMRPARKSWTPAIKAAGLGMLPTGSVGSIRIVATDVAGTGSVQETSHATPCPGPCEAFRPAAGHHPTWLRVAGGFVSGGGGAPGRGEGAGGGREVESGG